MGNEINIHYEKKPLPSNLMFWGLGLTLVGLVLIIIAYMVDPLRASFNMNIIFMFALSIGMGSLFLVGLEYIGGAVWSVPFRRISEIFTSILIVAPILAIPVILNMHGLFHWTHTEVVATDPILKNKAPYLNETFFIIRTVVIFLVLWLFTAIFVRRSLKQDKTKDQKLTWRNSVTAAIMMPVYAIMITVMSMDYLMSLEPHWFSTIFGIYYFAGTLLSAFAVLTIASVSLNEKGYLVKGLNKDHFYNLGAFMFAFINFWAYIAFSQFMLIWYANIPEETFWFMMRMEDGWGIVAIGLILVHFVIPYAGLLSQPSKSNPKNLKFFAGWILFAHYYDLYWIVMPTYSHTAGKHGVVLSWMEFVFPIFLVGMVITVFVLVSRKRNLVAIGDPKLARGVNFHL